MSSGGSCRGRDSYWVMSARVVPPEASCELPNPYGCNYVERDAFVLERYGFEAGAFAGVEQTGVADEQSRLQHRARVRGRDANGRQAECCRSHASTRVERLERRSQFCSMAS